MKNKQLLFQKQKMYLGYLKVINLKRIKLQNKINNYKKQIAFVKGTIMAMQNIKDTLNKESNFLSFFENNPSLSRPKLKDIYIFLETSDNTNVGKYSDKKIVEFINNNVRLQQDNIFIIGKRLFDHLNLNLVGFNIKLLGDVEKGINNKFIDHFSIIFDKISEISFTLYADNLVNKVTLLYSDIKNPSKLFTFLILPFDLNQLVFNTTSIGSNMVSINNKEAIIANQIFNDFNPEISNQITFISQITSINESFLKLFLSSLTKYVVVNFLLNMALRQMLNFDEEEKNLEERMNKNRVYLQAARNEAITNEMTLIASARKIVLRKKAIEIMHVKKDEETF